MDLRIGTTTPGPAAPTPASTRAVDAGALAPLAERYVGDLITTDATDRPQPLFAGARVGAPEGYANAADAATALATATDGRETPAAVLVQRPGSARVDAFVLEAPVWKKNWFRTEVVGSTPAHMDAQDGNDGVLSDGITARTANGSVQGRLAEGTYGPVLGSVVGIVDDTWGRLSNDVVDLGAPFTVGAPSVKVVPKADSKGAIEARITELRAGVEKTGSSLRYLAQYGREAEPHLVSDAWGAARNGIETIDSVLGYGGLPSEVSTPLTRLREQYTTVHETFSKHGRLTGESTAWAAGVATSLSTTDAALASAVQSPWLTDLDKAEVAKILTTALGAADSRIGRSIGQLLSVAKGSEASEPFMSFRKEARTLNLAAQEQLETLFTRKGVPKAVVSALRSADASLEDATWQIVGKPSPDGRFNGVDIPGAIRDTRDAIKLLEGLVAG